MSSRSSVSSATLPFMADETQTQRTSNGNPDPNSSIGHKSKLSFKAFKIGAVLLLLVFPLLQNFRALLFLHHHQLQNDDRYKEELMNLPVQSRSTPNSARIHHESTDTATSKTQVGAVRANKRRIIPTDLRLPRDNIVYQPASTERDIMNMAEELGFNTSNNPATCKIWNETNATTASIHGSLTAYAKELDEYNELIKKFEPVSSIMDKIKQGQKGDEEEQSKICESLRLHPNGMKGIFPSLQLSFSSSGYVEPLLPPMRSHKVCQEGGEQHLMSLDYLVHDFESMCRQLKPTSKLILLDMGAALDFHGNNQPIVSLLRQYEKFGFVFDHIYGFEISQRDPNVVYETSLPEEYMASYHWINVGVSAEEGHKLNPFHSILKKFNEDDFVVVKLDIDTAAVELPLFRQLLEDKDGIYSKTIDQFYFEHHHYLGELAPYWACGKPNMCNGTVAESLEMFSNLRKNGIPAHYWP